MAQARHIGKVVLSLPRQGPALRPDRTYVVTGGLGALGREVTAWLADHGARHLALIGRSAPSDAARQFIAQLELKGASVRPIQADVARYPELAEGFARLSSDWPPIAGIIHAAGVVDDAPLLKQAWDRFAAVLAPKATAVRNLHLLTRGQPIEFFFLFSSIASVLGSGGQSNYAAANAFLDAFAHHRSSLGLPATTINWGPWEDAGMAARLAADQRDRWTRLGLQSLTPERALSLLSLLLVKPRTQIVAIPIDWAQFLRTTPPEFVPSLLREIAAGFNPAAATCRDPSAPPPFIEELKRAHPRRRRALLLAHVLGQVRKVLGLTDDDPLDPQQGLTSLGMDSLMAVELRSRLQTTVGCALPATMAFEYPNLEAITDYLAGEILGPDGPRSADADPLPTPAPAAPANQPPPTDHPQPALDDLSEAELASLLDQKLSALGKQ
jgi:NAD(P)-dependent dehydrogenase (short-subunit alcohol dehydrogenase family)/acyl carrier protein